MLDTLYPDDFGPPSRERKTRRVYTPTPPSTPKRKRPLQKQSPRQTLCCVLGCPNPAANRNGQILRLPTPLKEDFVDKGWLRICTRHYFADLYAWKKTLK